MNQMCYFDANATTSVSNEVKKAMCRAINLGNPSSDYGSALLCRKILERFREECAKATSARGFRVIATSGGSESLCGFIRSVIEAWRARRSETPTIVCSEIEHKAVLECCKHLERIGDVKCRWVPPGEVGFVHPEKVRAAIDGTTALVCVMAANNETGACNNVHAIAEICRERRVPYLCDTVQAIGKIPFVPPSGVTAFVISMHKIHGPKGVGALLIRESAIDSLRLGPIIHGSQNMGMRGGTENVPGITGSLVALEQMALEAERFARLRGVLLRTLQRGVVVTSLEQYIAEKTRKGFKPAMEVVVLTPGVVQGHEVGLPEVDLALPNTLLLSVVARKKHACNTKMRKSLADMGFIVSVGSACNTSSEKASHVLKAMRVDPLIIRGVLRVSFERSCSTEKNMVRFAHALLEVMGEFS